MAGQSRPAYTHLDLMWTRRICQEIRCQLSPHFKRIHRLFAPMPSAMLRRPTDTELTHHLPGKAALQVTQRSPARHATTCSHPPIPRPAIDHHACRPPTSSYIFELNYLGVLNTLPCIMVIGKLIFSGHFIFETIRQAHLLLRGLSALY